jgi:Na+-driven multidrug efflux pump
MLVFILAMVINIPLSILFAKTFNLGSSGVILATVVCQLLHLIYLPIQYKKIVANEAFGIWGK